MNNKPSTQPQLLLWSSDVVPNGAGGFTVTARRPVAVDEIGTSKAAQILGVCRAQMWYIRNQKLGQQLLKWRFTSSGKGKILWELQSVLAYKEATKEIED